MRIDPQLLQLLHDWVVVAEYDAGYVLARCAVCSEESLVDLMPAGPS